MAVPYGRKVKSEVSDSYRRCFTTRLATFSLPVKQGLRIPMMNVRAVDADALLPSAAAIISQKGLTLHSIVMLLWDILIDLDDLSPSTSRQWTESTNWGQQKVVNVHRLIMRGTMEEGKMSPQKFKTMVANDVINAENASLKTMNTDQLFDLFTSADTKKGAAASKGYGNFDGDSKFAGTGKGLKAILGGLGELWDESQYTEEYNLSAKLNG